MIDLQGASRHQVRLQRQGNPSWVDLGDGRFALHIQYGGNAVVVDVGRGSEDAAAMREWLEFHWPQDI